MSDQECATLFGGDTKTDVSVSSMYVFLIKRSYKINHNNIFKSICFCDTLINIAGLCFWAQQIFHSLHYCESKSL